MGGYERYRVRLSRAGKYRIGLNIVRTGKIGVKGLILEYGEYSAEYSPTPSLKPFSWVRIFCGGVVIISRVQTVSACMLASACAHGESSGYRYVR